jgi:hypothetical protein
VLECLDGQTRVDEVAPLVAAAFRLPDLPTREVDDCLARFEAEGLVEAPRQGGR